MLQISWRTKIHRLSCCIWLALALLLIATPGLLRAQLDQGAITGTVTDPKGSVIPGASVRLTNTDTNFVLETQSDGSGVYVFQPIKIGHYSVTVTANGFATTTKTGLELHASERLEGNVRLQVGNVTENLEVTADSLPLLQTESATTGQVMTESQINDIPLNQRNYVFLSQLTSGTAPSNGSRGQGNGDFVANGQRAPENNFILDGVDNNSNSIDFLNGASYNVKPPPDALQEFSVVTSASSAEFGHSAGAVVNASIKSGTNHFHGDVWEYIRNNDLGEAPSTQWASGQAHPTVEPYHQNQFGGTIGGPIIRNKAFFFFDYEGNRIIEDFPQIASVPTNLMRTEPGNFSELLNPVLTGSSLPWQLFEPNTEGGPINPSTGNPSMYLGSACGNAVNVMCPAEISPIASKILQAAYPSPNTGAPGQTYNNYGWNQPVTDTTNQFDARVDYNPSARDQVFGRVSWSHEKKYVGAVLGPVFDGGATDNDGSFINNAKNAVISWNHVFSPKLINQLRFSYNWGAYSWWEQSYNNGGLDAQYGLGGLASYSAALGNGGLPQIWVNQFTEIGPPLFQPSPEGQNVYQIIDDATRILGNHSLKFGVDIQNVRYSVYQPTFSKGAYNYNGGLTGLAGSIYPSGYGLADFLADQMNATYVSDPTPTNNGHWYRAAYLQDDWKLNRRLSVNLGARYDFFSPPVERKDTQAEFYPTSPISGPGASGVYLFPQSQKGVVLNSAYMSELSADNIAIQFTGNRSLLNAQHMNFAPRIGVSYGATDKMVVRSGFGIYYAGLENLGNYVNLGANYPYDVEQSFFRGNCNPATVDTTGAITTNCPSDGIYLATGPAASSSVSAPTLTGWDRNIHSSYTINQNLTLQYAINSNMTATLGYVGAESRHLGVVVWPDGWTALVAPGDNVDGIASEPYPAFNGNIHQQIFEGTGNYNSMQAKLERRFTNGMSFLSTYTWSHSLDDAREPLPSSGDGGDRMYPVLGLRDDYSNSPFDTRQRFVFTGTYELPIGEGRKFLNKRGVIDTVVGGWDSTLLFRTQKGNPFTVSSNTSTVAGATAFPSLVSDPFKGGGTVLAPNTLTSCPTKVHNRANWYNPCAFLDPPLATSITTPVTGKANILPYLGSPRSQMVGPGWQRIDMTLTKNFKTFESQYLQFRADVYNLFNTPSWGAPSNQSTGPNGGQITGNAFLGNYTPDPRFFQLALKYYF